jgi:3-phenylpropionate/cinnamic acid dioxygenase small subunit
VSSVNSSLPILDLELNHKIQQFLYYEMELLDDKRFHDWLALFADDVRYWMPIRRVRPPRERHLEVASSLELAIFDETKADLKQRVRKIDTGKSWAEEPPSRTRHCITNVRVRKAENGWEVRSNMAVFQRRQDRSRYEYCGERTDLIREEGEGAYGLMIARRTIVLDDTTLDVPSVAIFF